MDNPTPRQRAAAAAARARLEREDPREITAAANASSRHVRSLERWEQEAREKHPDASGEEITSKAIEMRSGFYREIGRRSGQSRREAAAAAPKRRQSDPAWWERKAREENPDAADEEIAVIAGQLRDGYRERGAELAAAARRSPMHVSNPQRWLILARREHPDAGEAEISDAAARLRAEHYERIAGKRAARREAPGSR